MKNTQLNKEKLELFLEDIIQKRFKMPKCLNISDCIEVRYDTDTEKYEATLDRGNDFSGARFWNDQGEIARFMQDFHSVPSRINTKNYLEEVMQDYLDHEVKRLKENNTERKIIQLGSAEFPEHTIKIYQDFFGKENFKIKKNKEGFKIKLSALKNTSHFDIACGVDYLYIEGDYLHCDFNF